MVLGLISRIVEPGYLVFLDGAVGFSDTNGKGEAEGHGGNADDNRGQDQDVGQRVGIDRKLWRDDGAVPPTSLAGTM